MKSVLISIQPKWCELIAIGEKTIEVRKTQPNMATPFKCYIYETQGKTETPWVDEEGHMIFRGRGMVIGEFVCDKIITAKCGNYVAIPTEESCLDALALMDYADEKTVYGWHISDLVIYDEPKPLSNFIKCHYPWDCGVCDYYDSLVLSCNKPKRPPQSWCYVEG